MLEEPEKERGFCREHWCMWIYILLAVIGITVPTYMYLKPCEDELTTYVEPVDVFMLIDASKSLSETSWEGEKDAAAQFLEELDQDVEDLQVGFLTFTGHWENKDEGKEPVLRDINNLSEDIDSVTSNIDGLGDSHSYLQIGTNFHEPLMECKRQLELFGRDDSYKLCVLMTDGEDMSSSVHRLPPKYKRKYGECARGCSDPIEAATEVKSLNNTEIMAIYSGSRAQGKSTLYQMSSCDSLDLVQEEECDYFTQVDDFPDLRHKVANLTEGIVEQITRTHMKCVKGPWLGFLALLIPLIVMIFLPHCLRCCGALRTVKKTRVINETRVPPPPPPMITEQQETPPPPYPAMEKKVKKAYKWEVDTGSYIRSAGNITPDWGKGGYVPKSAPQKGEKRKITVDNVDEADHVEYEYYEVEQTLEEWAEERMSGAATNIGDCCYWFWCCCGLCCCYKQAQGEDDIALLDPSQAVE